MGVVFSVTDLGGLQYLIYHLLLPRCYWMEQGKDLTQMALRPDEGPLSPE